LLPVPVHCDVTEGIFGPGGITITYRANNNSALHHWTGIEIYHPPTYQMFIFNYMHFVCVCRYEETPYTLNL